MGLFGPSKSDLDESSYWLDLAERGDGKHASRRGGPAYKSATSYKGRRRGGDADAAKGRGKGGKPKPGKAKGRK